jgi:hypothetical protein
MSSPGNDEIKIGFITSSTRSRMSLRSALSVKEKGHEAMLGPVLANREIKVCKKSLNYIKVMHIGIKTINESF